jgi:hypothetical protein
MSELRGGNGGEIDLERTAKSLLVPQKLEEFLVCLCAASDEVYSVSIGSSNLDVLAAVVKT